MLEHLIRAAEGCWWHHLPRSTAALGAGDSCSLQQHHQPRWNTRLIPHTISWSLPFLFLAAVGYPRASKEQTDLGEQNEARAGFSCEKGKPAQREADCLPCTEMNSYLCPFITLMADGACLTTTNLPRPRGTCAALQQNWCNSKDLWLERTCQADKERRYWQEHTAPASGLPEGFLNSVHSTDWVGGFLGWLSSL